MVLPLFFFLRFKETAMDETVRGLLVGATSEGHLVVKAVPQGFSRPAYFLVPARDTAATVTFRTSEVMASGESREDLLETLAELRGM